MRIDSQFKIGILLLFLLQSAFAAEQQLAACTAPSNYLNLLKLDSQRRESGLDYSCLASYQSLSTQLNLYQLVNVSADHTSLGANAWIIPAADLKYKQYLANRKLLLISEGFSRIQAARLCAEIKNAGFKQTKILINGREMWQSLHKKKQVPVYVDPSDVITEVASGGNVILVTTVQESAGLSRLGFENIALWDGINLPDQVFISAQNGFNPVVIVEDMPLNELTLNRLATLFGFYILKGGVAGLKMEISRNATLNRSRLQSLQGSFCAKS